MIVQKYKDMLQGKSVIRQLSEFATARGAEIGYENVFDYSLGNPSVPAPQQFTDTMIRLLREKDPMELTDVAGDPAYTKDLEELTEKLISHLYGSDEKLLENGKLKGLPQKKYDFSASLQDGNKLFQGRDMLLQRGIR